MKKTYNQANVTVLVNGIPLQGFSDGAPITVAFRGGEVDFTDGMDGPAINQATKQGGTIRVRLRESSPSLPLLSGFRLAQENGMPGVVVSIRSGVDAIWTLIDAYLSQPSEFSTGDKRMSAIEYTFAGIVLAPSNFSIPNLF